VYSIKIIWIVSSLHLDLSIYTNAQFKVCSPNKTNLLFPAFGSNARQNKMTKLNRLDFFNKAFLCIYNKHV